MHRNRAGKRQQKQPTAAPIRAYPTSFHRRSTGLSTLEQPTNGDGRVAHLRQPNVTLKPGSMPCAAQQLRAAVILCATRKYEQARTGDRDAGSSPRARRDQREAGQTAERRQDGVPARPKHEAGQAHRFVRRGPRGARRDARGRTARSRCAASRARGTARTAARGCGSATTSTRQAAGGSPAFASWLPRTSVIASSACASRQARERGVERGHAARGRVQEVAEHDQARARACARASARGARGRWPSRRAAAGCRPRETPRPCRGGRRRRTALPRAARRARGRRAARRARRPPSSRGCRPPGLRTHRRRALRRRRAGAGRAGPWRRAFGATAGEGPAPGRHRVARCRAPVAHLVAGLYRSERASCRALPPT